jgi:hypothetical protein
MTKPTIEMAQTVARLAPLKVSFSDATKLCKSRHPRMNEFDISVLAGWVERINKRAAKEAK